MPVRCALTGLLILLLGAAGCSKRAADADKRPAGTSQDVAARSEELRRLDEQLAAKRAELSQLAKESDAPRAQREPGESAPPAPIARDAKYQPGDVVKLIAYGRNRSAWIVSHPREFAKLHEQERIGDKEGNYAMQKEGRFFFIKPGTKVRILRRVSEGAKPGEDVYEIRITEFDANESSRTESYGLAGFTYEYCLDK